MKNPRKTTKTVVNNLVGFGIGSATSNIVRSSIPRSNNPIIDTIVVVSTFATSWMVASTVHNPVRTETERQIDSLFDAIAEMKKQPTT